MLKEEPRTPPHPNGVQIRICCCCRCLRKARPGLPLHLALSLAAAETAKLLLPCCSALNENGRMDVHVFFVAASPFNTYSMGFLQDGFVKYNQLNRQTFNAACQLFLSSIVCCYVPAILISIYHRTSPTGKKCFITLFRHPHFSN